MKGERWRCSGEKNRSRKGKRGKREKKKKLEIWEAAGIFLVVVWDGENGLLEFVVAELLKRHGGRDGGKHGDVCNTNRK